MYVAGVNHRAAGAVRSSENTALVQPLGHIHHISHTSLPLQRDVEPNGSIQDRPPSGMIWLRIQSQGNRGNSDGKT